MFRLEHLLATIGEQLARERRGASGGFANLLDVAMPLDAPGGRRAHEFRAADDDREQVVEIVSDTARELAHRVHLLRMPKLLLELSTCGDVGEHHDDAVHAAVARE